MTDSDGLALPIDLDAKYGAGHRRAIVLGGGGIFFIAWQVSYLRELERRGVHLGEATVVVGTSAGSVVAAMLAGDRLGLVSKELAVMAKLPSVIAAMAPSGDLTPSQARAVGLFREATDAHPTTVRAIGYAALAADAVPAAKLHRSVASLVAQRSWPAQSLMITTVDAYTGERLVLRANSGVPVSRAAAASSSVPGLFSPQPVLDRRCMDGGVSGSGTHTDLAVGAERVVILSLGAENPAREAMMTIQPNSLAKESDAVRAAGGEVFIRGPLETDIDTLMSPASVPAAIEMGVNQAAGDADALRAFWH
ncbi:MAG: hypothetical protein QG597_113 [Actinomycetota bacterium]|nr:hypothetical protein [Actinomycetota bacterium]